MTETAEFTIQEVENVCKQIADLEPTQLVINNCNVIIKHILNFTMIDVKLVNTLISTNLV